MDIQLIYKKVEDVVGPALAHLGYELVEREFLQESGRWTLRLYIDKEGGVTIDDCATASRSIEDLIEVEEIVPCAYSLEVSSPGINRPLRWKKDFERFKGSQIKLKATEQIDGRGNYKGTLEGLEGDDIVIIVDGTRFKVPYSMLAKARLDVEILPVNKS